MEGLPCRILTLAGCQPHARIEQLVSAAQEAGVVVERPRDLSCGMGLQVWSAWARLARVREGIIWTWGLRADLVGKLAAVLHSRVRLVCALRSADRGRIVRDRRLMRFLSGRVDAYVANSHYNCELLQLAVPNTQPRCHVIYNALTEHELAEPTIELPDTVDRLRAVMLGNIRMRVKGYDTVLRAARLLAEKSAPVEFHVSGRGDEAQSFLAERKRLGLESVLQYHGETDRPVDFLRRGHLFLLASRVEGMPNALLEAMNLGLPCISTRVGDVGRFAEDKVHLRVVEVGGVEEIVTAIEAVRSDWFAARQMGAAGRRLCQDEFSPDRMIQRAKAVLAELA